jgi:hypothetical protein
MLLGFYELQRQVLEVQLEMLRCNGKVVMCGGRQSMSNKWYITEDDPEDN